MQAMDIQGILTKRIEAVQAFWRCPSRNPPHHAPVAPDSGPAGEGNHLLFR